MVAQRMTDWSICLATVMGVVLLGASSSAGKGADPSSDELVSMVLDALQSNFSLIKTAKLTVRDVLEDATVGKDETTVSQLPDGSEIRMMRSQRSEWEGQIVLSGEDLRVDLYAKRFGNGEVAETRAFRNGIWTHYAPRNSAAWVHRMEHMPGMFPIDPRQVGSDDVRRSVKDILREDRIVSAELKTSDPADMVVRIVAESARGAQMAYEFASKEGFLPTRLETRWPDGSLLQLVDFEYRDVLDGQARFLQRLTRRFYAEGVTRQPQSTGWRQRFSRELIGEIEFNQPISADSFHVQFRPGTRISDNTRRIVYAAQTPIPEKTLPWWYATGIVGCTIVLVSLRAYRHYESS